MPRRLEAVHAGFRHLNLPRLRGRFGDLPAVFEQRQLCRGGECRGQAQPRREGNLVAHDADDAVACLRHPPEPPRFGGQLDGEVGMALAERVVHHAGGQLAGRRQEVRADELEHHLVGRELQPRDVELMGVGGADAGDHTALPDQLVPGAERVVRPVEDRPVEWADRCRERPEREAQLVLVERIVRDVVGFDAGETGDRPVPPPRLLKIGVRDEPEAALPVHLIDDLLRRHLVPVDLLGDVEREVVAGARGDLHADEDEHLAVPALPALAQPLERVVVRDDDVVELLGVGDPHGILEFAVRIVRIRSVDVDDARVVHVGVRRLLRALGGRAWRRRLGEHGAA